MVVYRIQDRATGGERATSSSPIVIIPNPHALSNQVSDQSSVCQHQSSRIDQHPQHPEDDRWRCGADTNGVELPSATEKLQFDDKHC